MLQYMQQVSGNTDNSHFLQYFSCVVMNVIPPTVCLSEEQCLTSVEMNFF